MDAHTLKQLFYGLLLVFGPGAGLALCGLLFEWLFTRVIGPDPDEVPWWRAGPSLDPNCRLN